MTTIPTVFVPIVSAWFRRIVRVAVGPSWS
jgi:hypothetical protein